MFENEQEVIARRFKTVAFVKDYRLFKLDKNSYRILILPEPDGDRRSIKGAVLDALVDLFGIKRRYDIDIIEEDDALMP
ncbi:MAG: hypothetical protein IJ667_04870 [Synergistaceae bacterium]|nr:hypothetical protein [Synergistaceae bacterium]